MATRPEDIAVEITQEQSEENLLAVHRNLAGIGPPTYAQVVSLLVSILKCTPTEAILELHENQSIYRIFRWIPLADQDWEAANKAAVKLRRKAGDRAEAQSGWV